MKHRGDHDATVWIVNIVGLIVLIFLIVMAVLSAYGVRTT